MKLSRIGENCRNKYIEILYQEAKRIKQGFQAKVIFRKDKEVKLIGETYRMIKRLGEHFKKVLSYKEQTKQRMNITTKTQS